MISYEAIDANAELFRKQLDRFVGFDGKTSFSANNKDWLADLNYIDFLRDIGSHFSVNRMLSFEAYKARLETGLSFVEFNYQLLQSYDFLELYRRHGCRLQIGGDDQWGNIVAGMELIRRVEGAEAFGLTFPLVMTHDGKKMGKTEKGALFLDPAMTRPYEFFQYWRNVSDADVLKFLLMFTFLPAAECRALAAPGGRHQRRQGTPGLGGHGPHPRQGRGGPGPFGRQGGLRRAAATGARCPPSSFRATGSKPAYPVLDLFVDAGLAQTKSEARRLVQQGGAFVGEAVWKDEKAAVGSDRLDSGGELVLRAGKKRFCRIVAK